MDAAQKKLLRHVVLGMRHILDGTYESGGTKTPGDIEQRLAAIGVRRDRDPIPLDELPQLDQADRAARRVTDAYLLHRKDAGVAREEAIAELVRETSYSWVNRLLALRCMEARELIDEVVVQKESYGGRSLEHYRYATRHPAECTGEDAGLFAALFHVFEERATSLPLLFDPESPGVAVRPSVPALRACIRLLTGEDAALFRAPDTLGWAYQFYQEEEKNRVDEQLRTKKGYKCEGADIVPKTSLYTEDYMVSFLVENSLGATWRAMHPKSRLSEQWDHFVVNADRSPADAKPVAEITFLDPACGSGHFLVAAFDLFYEMYKEEGVLNEAEAICRSILANNLFGIDIDERAVQIAEAALWMKAAEHVPDFSGEAGHLVATNVRLPAGRDHLEEFLKRHPDDAPIRAALETAFGGLEHADEIGSLLHIEEAVQNELERLRKRDPLFHSKEDATLWQREVLARIENHFHEHAESADGAEGFFGSNAERGITLFDLLSRRYDVVATNPPYMGSKNMGPVLKRYVESHYKPGKRDLYAAFILRCIQLAAPGGRVAMVTQQSWMFLRSYTDLRAVDEETARTLGAGAFKGVLRDTSIESLAHLGEHAFEEQAAAGAFVVLFTLAKREPADDHRLTAFRLIGPKSPVEKDRLLLASVKEEDEG